MPAPVALVDCNNFYASCESVFQPQLRGDCELANVLSNAALGRRPVEGWSANAYEQFTLSLADLRRKLFGLALANDAQSRLGEACLVEIEELRDEHGRIDDEPRHPDISSVQSWLIVR
ncbi:hypothetical protein I6F33_28050 [Bradyrhizobium sp. BRP20]|uniref:hypothetical protein n=1 Tax=unclassified Bradyrhizobium TaxID=2631580 RepID=UPI001CD20268|nr:MULTISPECIES: hypothetical protein [unclassified Bradyrhizobium]MCA1436803.1 hypothetical protein [Bradyrhizobium sp. BRP20]MCA1470717.1 hypothetical protein [Bradyrhizobium sp. IC3195]MCA1550879.1 hypothetical protein [Bradyrhizobium sp. BRP19]